MSKPKSRAFVFSWILLFSTGTVAQWQSTALNESTRALNRGDYGKASELAKAHLRRSPGDVAVRVILARAEFSQGQLEIAFENLRKALALDPKNIDALFYLSLVAKELSKEENRRLFSLAPDSERVHQILGETAIAAGNQGGAEEEFQKVVEINPNSVTGLMQLAELRRSQFKFDEAINYYLRVERLDPMDYETAYGLGSSYASKREFPAAIEWFRKAVALARNSAPARFALANALFQDNQFEAAIPELKSSLQMDPSMSQAYSLLSRAYSKLGRIEEAQATLQKLKEFNRTVMHGESKPNGDPAANQR